MRRLLRSAEGAFVSVGVSEAERQRAGDERARGFAFCEVPAAREPRYDALDIRRHYLSVPAAPAAIQISHPASRKDDLSRPCRTPSPDCRMLIRGGAVTAQKRLPRAGERLITHLRAQNIRLLCSSALKIRAWRTAASYAYHLVFRRSAFPGVPQAQICGAHNPAASQ